VSYLPPEAPAALPLRYSSGPLATWLREALAEHLDPVAADRVFLRFELLYAQRRAMRRDYEPIPDLGRDARWLLKVLNDELKALGVGTHAPYGHPRDSIRKGVEDRLEAWEGSEG